MKKSKGINVEYDFFDLENCLKKKFIKKEIKEVDVKIDITPKKYLEYITEEYLQKSYEFYEKINEHHAKAISDAYTYVVFK